MPRSNCLRTSIGAAPFGGGTLRGRCPTPAVTGALCLSPSAIRSKVLLRRGLKERRPGCEDGDFPETYQLTLFYEF